MPEKKKILYVHHSGANAGAPRSLAFLIDELDKEKYEPIVVCHHDYEGNKKLFESVGAKVVHAKYIGGWFGSTVSPISKRSLRYNITHVIPTYWEIKKIVKDIRPDLVHLNSTCLCFAGKSIRKSFPDLPIICHVREPLLEGFWGDILRRNCEKSVDAYIAIDRYDADSLHTKKRTEIIHNFVDFNVYNESVQSDCLKRELNLGSHEKILLYLARVSRANGALEFSKAAESFLKKRKDIHLCIVGANLSSTGEYTAALKKMAEENENIHLFGFRNDVPQVIASSDLMIAPFQVPHFARSVIEAAAMGVPSIASDIGGVNELIVNGETGFLLDPFSFEGLNEVCEKVLDHPEEYQRVSENAVRHAHEHFDSKTNAERTFRVYQELLK